MPNPHVVQEMGLTQMLDQVRPTKTAARPAGRAPGPSEERDRRRILVIDDNPAIHADVRKILCPPQTEAFDALARTGPLMCRMSGSGSALFAVYLRFLQARRFLPAAIEAEA